ncbi:SoxR reducing system RseC family protein [Candidatus Pacearchaeota archaeon]|nr:SoxR reducing system RseC family protein [Candidatus Pacearchaeota archaeon]
MIKEQAYVVSVEEDYAIVIADRRSSCGSCSINKSCGTSVLSNVVGNKQIQLSARNGIDASVGEHVVIGIPEHVILYGSFLMYLIPLLGLLLGSIFGAALSPQLNLSDGFVAICGISGLMLSFLFVNFMLIKKPKGEEQVVIVERLSEYSHEHIIKIHG